MKARLVRLRCFVKVLVIRRSGVFLFAAPTSCCVLNATRSDRTVHSLSLREKVDQCNLLRRKKGVHDRRENFL